MMNYSLRDLTSRLAEQTNVMEEKIEVDSFGNFQRGTFEFFCQEDVVKQVVADFDIPLIKVSDNENPEPESFIYQAYVFDTQWDSEIKIVTPGKIKTIGCCNDSCMHAFLLKAPAKSLSYLELRADYNTANGDLMLWLITKMSSTIEFEDIVMN